MYFSIPLFYRFYKQLSITLGLLISGVLFLLYYFYFNFLLQKVIFLMFIVFCFVSFPTISKVPYPLYQPTNPPVQSVLSIHLIIFPVSIFTAVLQISLSALPPEPFPPQLFPVQHPAFCGFFIILFSEILIYAFFLSFSFRYRFL